MNQDTVDRCYHCGEPLNQHHTYSAVIGETKRHFCCNGCLSACLIIYGAGEESYYKKRSSPAPKLFDTLPDSILSGDGVYIAPEAKSKLNQAYDIPSVLDEYVESQGENRSRILLSIQGIHCSSCVFINERILSKTKGIHDATVNYETGRASILYDPSIIKLSQIIGVVQSIGYDARPIRSGQRSESIKKEGQELLWKMGLSAFLAGNTMLIAMSLWFNFFDHSMTPKIKEFFHWWEFLFATPAFFYSGSVFHRGWKSFLRSGFVGMDFLISTGISIAYFYSVFVVFSKSGEVYFDSVTTIIFFLLVGRYFEWMAKYKQRLRMEELVRPLPAHCTRIRNDEEEIIGIKELKRGDVIKATPGMELPADGILMSDRCEVDESVLTGESMPVLRASGDRLLAGSRIVSGEAMYRVDSLPEESSLSVLSRLADSAGMGKSGIERITLKIIPYFSTAILLVAAGAFLGWYFWGGLDFNSAIVVAIAVLIVSCPCALALAVPTAIGSGMYLGLTRGILVRDGGVLEALNRVDQIFFDKTGTITRGKPSVVNALHLTDLNDSLNMIEFMEQGSPHPVGKALLDYVRKMKSGSNDLLDSGHAIQEIPGKGILLHSESDEYRLGNIKYLEEGGVSLTNDVLSFLQENHNTSIVGLSRGDQLYSVLALKDTPEENAIQTIRSLKQEGLGVSILTGDNVGASRDVGKLIGLDDKNVYAGLLPSEKETIVKASVDDGNTVAMVGDGYNDAIALSRASVSIVLSRGAPLSLEHAGLILLQNDLQGLNRARTLARRTLRTITLNLSLSLLYNSIMIPIAASGLLQPVWCALFMSASSLTVVGISILLRMRG